MGIDFSIQLDETTKPPILAIAGEIDIYTCPKLNKSLTDAIDKGHTTLVIDLTKVQYIDSTGLGNIAHIAKKVDLKNGLLHIICDKPQIKKIFEISGLLKKNIIIYEKIDELDDIIS